MHDGNGSRCFFYSSCCTTGASSNSEQDRRGWTSSSLGTHATTPPATSPTQRNSHGVTNSYISDGHASYVSNEMHGNGLVWATKMANFPVMASAGMIQKIHFPSSSAVGQTNCAISGYAIKMGWLECWCRDHQRLFILETDTQSSPLVPRCVT